MAEASARPRALADFVSVMDQSLSADFCGQLIDRFERMEESHQPNGAGIRPGLEDSAWVEMDLVQFRDAGIRDRLTQVVRTHFDAYHASLDLTLPLSPIRKMSALILKRYQPGENQRFQVHFDALGPVSNRYLTYLWYLNDVERGGETTFPDLDLRVEARCGRLLMFPPYWMFQHAGLPPQSGPKYILSTYCLY